MIRRRTDIFFSLFVPLNFLLWLGIAIYEIQNDPYKSTAPIRRSNYYLDLILLRSLANISIYSIISILITISFLFIASALKARWIVFVAISLIVITISSFIVLIPWELTILIFNSAKSHSSVFIIAALVATLLYLSYQVTIFVCTKETNVNLTAELISQSCPAILHSFLALSVSLAIAFLSIIALMITMNTSLSKLFDYFPWDNNYGIPATSLDILRLSIFLIGGMHLFNFIWNFGFAVTSDYFAHFYARSENEKPRNAYIFQSTSRIAKYHLGTVALLSMPILPSVCALIMAFKTNRRCSTKSTYASINFFSKLCLIADISDYALVQTSINGYKAFKSISEMFELGQRSSLLFLTLNAISTKIIEICIVLATIVGMIVRLWSLPMYHDIPLSRNPTHSKLHVADDTMAVYQVFIAAVYISCICKSVMRSAMCTFSIYQMNCIRMTDTMDDHIAIAEQSI
ncbi:uncharacterized protein LOC131663211 [Phymastichus coffea]|uniref:uncharacterized protein LOC131663211 n=1 Tax=Phymastichus coffea TaxID=108790 RepID=UPI00273A83FC|nr:uncharacterized protein LOC131663211 [Phymastichus coffea]